jgi:hypothetical protein
MMWAIGAAAAWWLLASWPQMALVALLAPAWLTAEWVVATDERFTRHAYLVPTCGIFLLSLVYFTSNDGAGRDIRRRTLTWIGGVALVPASVALWFAAAERYLAGDTLTTGLLAIGWGAALLLPLALSAVLKRQAAWPILAAVAWVLVLITLRSIGGEASLYAWWGLGATGLAAWGVHEARSERINMGAAVFAATVVGFYFSHVMDKLGRSASLIGLGLVFLGGGWAIEQARRRLVLQARGGHA